MTAAHLLPRPKSEADAERSFLKQTCGDPRLLNKYLAATSMAAVAIAGLLAFTTFRLATQQRERIVVRIDDVGRAQAVGFSSTGAIKPPEAKYFLAQFVSTFYGRKRATIREDFTRSMMFLNAPMASARMEENRKSQEIEKFALGGDDEIDIQVKNIILDDLSKAPYSAQVDLEKVYRDRVGNETKREKYVDSIRFTVAPEIQNAAILVNPLGLVVVAMHEDQVLQ